MARYTMGVWQAESGISRSSPFVDAEATLSWLTESVGLEVPDRAQLMSLVAEADGAGIATRSFDHPDGPVTCHMIHIGWADPNAAKLKKR